MKRRVYIYISVETLIDISAGSRGGGMLMMNILRINAEAGRRTCRVVLHYI